ncbi:MAG TPA: HD domain-containing protein [Herpetosiphonaceae bacterium]|nr:HD domain-containing protein [Herpetosiphonaceae bacterium]
MVHMIDDLLSHPKVVETQSHLHHSISKHDHLLRSARISYKLARALGADVRTCVRAAIIHDIDSRKGTLANHGRIAAQWAASQGEDHAVCHAIETHMYPIGPAPRTREAWVVSLADKAASLTDLTICVTGMLTGRTWDRRRALRASDPYYPGRRHRRRARQRDAAWSRNR